MAYVSVKRRSWSDWRKDSIMRKASCLGLCFRALILIVPGAEPPDRVNYQGHLTDDGGSPLTGVYDISFRLHDDETAGDLLLTNTHAGPGGVAVTHGQSPLNGLWKGRMP